MINHSFATELPQWTLMICVLLMFRIYPLQNVNQAEEARATTAEMSSVLSHIFLKGWALSRKPILGDRTLIHYLPCVVPSWHSVSIYFKDGRAGTVSLKQGPHLLNRLPLFICVTFDWDNFSLAEWCTVYQHYGSCFDSNGKMLERLLWHRGAVSVSIGWILL